MVGILPREFSFLGFDAQLFVPMAFEPGDHMNSHSNHFLRMFGRLRPGVSREQANDDLAAISKSIVAEQSISNGTVLNVIPLHDLLVGSDVRTALFVLLGAVGFVLLISCANLANLLLARAAVRRREVAVRLALGASRARLLRQFLAESLTLSLAGGLLGLAAAYASADTLNLISRQVLPRASDIRIDPSVLGFTFLVATATGILLGLAPAGHTVAADVNAGLKEGARGSSDGGGRGWLRRGLLVSEVALSLVLLIGAGLMVKSMYRLLRVDSGFNPEGVLTMQINLPARKYVDTKLEREFSPDAYTRAVAILHRGGRARAHDSRSGGRRCDQRPAADGRDLGQEPHVLRQASAGGRARPAPIQYRIVAGDYFRALGIRILNGRAFADADTVAAPRVAIVNQELVKRHWNGQSPLGKIISVNPPLQVLPKAIIEEARRAGGIPPNYEPDKFTVVGVADDALYGGLERSALPLVYVPYAQGSEGTTNMMLVVRTEGNPLAMTPAIREQIARIDREQPLANIQTMDARLASSVAQRRMQMNVLGAFAAMAILLAAIGIYGVMSYWVTQRSGEIGIRLALGAARSDVVGLVLRQGFRIVLGGLGLGLIGAWLSTRALRTLLFNVSATDPFVFTAIVILLSATACLATYVPARRAARLDPLTTLRSE